MAPQDPAVLDTLGRVLVAQGEPGRASEVLERAVSIAPDSLPIRLQLARALMAAGNPAKARAELQHAVRRSASPQERQEIERVREELNR